MGRPVICRAMRSAARFASVALSVNSHRATPNRRASSPATHSESSVGSIVVMPRSPCSARAASTDGGPCPVIAPVSPRHRSAYSCPSTSVMVAPAARAAKGGIPLAQRIIQGIGTPPMSDCWPRANRSAETGCPSAKRRSSRSVSSASQPRSIGEVWWVITTLSVADEQVINYFRVNSDLGGSFPHCRGLGQRVARRPALRC